MSLPIAVPPAGTVTTTPGGGAFFDGPEAVGAFRLIMLRTSLKFEAEHPGMKMTRVSMLKVAKQYGINKGTKKGAYNELNRLMVEAGFPDLGSI
jgi:hypothetical protein